LSQHEYKIGIPQKAKSQTDLQTTQEGTYENRSK